MSYNLSSLVVRFILSSQNDFHVGGVGYEADLVFLVDSSASVGADNFYNEIKFIRSKISTSRRNHPLCYKHSKKLKLFWRMSDAFSNGPDPDAILKIRPDPTDFAEILNLDPENILASGPGRETRVFWDFNIFSLMLNGFTESYWRISRCHTTPPGWSSSRTAQLTRFTQTSLNPNCLGFN